METKQDDFGSISIELLQYPKRSVIIPSTPRWLMVTGT